MSKTKHNAGSFDDDKQNFCISYKPSIFANMKSKSNK